MTYLCIEEQKRENSQEDLKNDDPCSEVTCLHTCLQI